MNTNFEWLYKRPEQNTYCISLTQKFDESGSAKQPQKSKTDKIAL